MKVGSCPICGKPIRSGFICRCGFDHSLDIEGYCSLTASTDKKNTVEYIRKGYELKQAAALTQQITEAVDRRVASISGEFASVLRGNSSMESTLTALLERVAALEQSVSELKTENAALLSALSEMETRRELPETETEPEPKPASAPAPVPTMEESVPVSECPTYPTKEFGTYQQKRAGNFSKIDWLVLDQNGGETLLLCNSILTFLAYDTRSGTTAWEDSTLRSWLNSDFIDSAFTEAEKNRLKTNNTCGDSVFLLSKEELQQYLPTEPARKATATTYAIRAGKEPSNPCAYWLRNEDEGSSLTAVLGNGSYHAGYDPADAIGIRPAIRLKW